MRLSGIGTTLLGVRPSDVESESTATEWFTFIYLPLVPLARYRLRFLPHTGSGFSYEILAREPIHAREVLTTYLNGWILTPIVLFSPLVLAVREVWSAIGLPESLYIPFVVLAILWLIVALWILLDRHEAKYWQPKPAQQSGK